MRGSSGSRSGRDQEEEEIDDLVAGDDLDEGTLVKIIRKMGQKAATEAAVAAYRVAAPRAVIVFDNFDAAPAGVVRMVRALSESAIIIAVSSETPKTHQKPFLFGCTRVEVKRLTSRETQELVERLIEPHPVRANEKARLVRHLVEESQGKAMSSITTRENLDDAPALGTTGADGASITRAVTLAKCLRCGFEWLPRKANPVKCPHCQTILWNVPRAQQLPGKPAPTRKGKPRGKAFSADYNPRRAREDHPPDQNETTKE